MDDINKKDLQEFLKSERFDLVQVRHFPELFGNFLEIWKSSAFNVRFVQDRAVQSIDISSPLDDNSWFELALIKSLIENDLILNTSLPIVEAITFLKNYFSEIQALFTPQSYSTTKKSLEGIRDTRMRQMFPNLYGSR